MGEGVEQQAVAFARGVSAEMEADGTWAQLRREVEREHPDRHIERRFILIRQPDGAPAAALWLRAEPWTDEAVENWMTYLWEHQRVGGFKATMSPTGEGHGHVEMGPDPDSKHPMGVP